MEIQRNTAVLGVPVTKRRSPHGESPQTQRVRSAESLGPPAATEAPEEALDELWELACASWTPFKGV